jgi:hypothetical protein
MPYVTPALLVVRQCLVCVDSDHAENVGPGKSAYLKGCDDDI